jgi:hypothetical protein
MQERVLEIFLYQLLSGKKVIPRKHWKCIITWKLQTWVCTWGKIKKRNIPQAHSTVLTGTQFSTFYIAGHDDPKELEKYYMKWSTGQRFMFSTQHLTPAVVIFETRHMTSIVLVRLKIQPKSTYSALISFDKLCMKLLSVSNIILSTNESRMFNIIWNKIVIYTLHRKMC